MPPCSIFNGSCSVAVTIAQINVLPCSWALFSGIPLRLPLQPKKMLQPWAGISASLLTDSFCSCSKHHPLPPSNFLTMGWFQLLLFSLEQSNPGCTVLLFCLSSLMPPSPFNVKPLRKVGYEMCVKRNSSTKKFKVLWYCRSKKKLNLPSFLYYQQQLWVGRTNRR